MGSGQSSEVKNIQIEQRKSDGKNDRYVTDPTTLAKQVVEKTFLSATNFRNKYTSTSYIGAVTLDYNATGGIYK